tara:strand:+ start:4411 stop:4614 length:204 start_codon:yes stop_codon:yes gene_type:complete
MNCTNQEIQIEQTGDIIQILFVAFTLIPLIASEILPFLSCDPNGLAHGLVLALSNMKYKERVVHPNP